MVSKKRVFNGMVAVGFGVLALGYGARANPELLSYISNGYIDNFVFARVVEYGDALLAGAINLSGLGLDPQSIYDYIKTAVSAAGALAYGKKAVSRD